MNLPPYIIYPTLINEKVSLRQVQTADIKNLIEISFYNAVQATSVEQATEMQVKIDKDYLDGNSIHWGIIDNLTNEIVGTCGFYRGLEKGEGELGCVLLPNFRGQGFMTSAMMIAIEFGLKTIGLKRIFAITSQQNTDAIKLLKRLDFEKFANLEDGSIEFELRIREF